MSLFQRLFPFLWTPYTRPGGLSTEKSRVLALSIARAVETDAAILEQYRREDQVARDRMIAQATNENRQISIEPLGNQLILDEETLNTLRLLNVDAPDDSESEDEGIKEAEELVDENDEYVQVTEHADNTGDTEDTHEPGYIPDDTEDNDDAPEVQTLGQQSEEATSSQEAIVEQEETVSHVDTVDHQVVQDQEDSQQPLDLVTLSTPPSPATASPSTVPPATERKQCMVCGEELLATDTLQTPCSHNWCRTCLVQAVELSMREESMFPPQCCQQAIPIEVGAFISQETFDRFREKTIEFETVDRTYCNDTACSNFITPQSIAESEGIARCSRCGLQTCPICKKAWHEGACAEDKWTQAVVRLGEREGWKSCGNCKHLIQRSTGCNQISESLLSRCFTTNSLTFFKPVVAVTGSATSVLPSGSLAHVHIRILSGSSASGSLPRLLQTTGREQWLDKNQWCLDEHQCHQDRDQERLRIRRPIDDVDTRNDMRATQTANICVGRFVAKNGSRAMTVVNLCRNSYLPAETATWAHAVDAERPSNPGNRVLRGCF
ncbi:hypothetical protein NW768_004660 [Fusarium equiseti]|uniref:RBR-type E3 ubiquitin transferase n=1 Tax=Fusarium equiseti TaxID=61235 RepID=A0ABQ8RGX7_FUSEQ|nr:hypothetical protein NW768_004660 [Fusarium equiseti]